MRDPTPQPASLTIAVPARSGAGIADVASAAQCSKTTVSFAFHHPERLAPRTVLRVRLIAASLGYRPSASAKRGEFGNQPAIGILVRGTLVNELADEDFVAFCLGVASVAEAAGYSIALLPSTPDPGQVRRGGREEPGICGWAVSSPGVPVVSYASEPAGTASRDRGAAAARVLMAQLATSRTGLERQETNGGVMADH